MSQTTESLAAVLPSPFIVVEGVDNIRAIGSYRQLTSIGVNPDRIFGSGKLIPSATPAAPLPPPFVIIDGVDNVRTIGTFIRSPFVKVKPNLIFRSGDVINMTSTGKTQFLDLKIKTVVDLRLEHGPDVVSGLEGVEWLSVPSEEKPAADTAEIAKMLENFETMPLLAFAGVYTDILASSGKTFELFFKHLRDKPNVPVLVHCSAGKDRTGIAIALLLLILHVNNYDIIYDYALSSIGLEAAMSSMIGEFDKHNQAYRENPLGLLNFLSSNPEAMAVTLVLVLDKFGGAENYLINHTSLQKADIEKIRKNVLL